MIKKALLGVGVIAVALAVGFYFAFRGRTRRAAEQLVERVVERDGRQRARTSHAPEPGSVGSRLLPLLEEKHPDTRWAPSCTDVMKGLVTFDRLPKECADVWTRDRAWAIAVMQASRAERWTRHPETLTIGELNHALSVATLEVWSAAPAQAVELCVDIIATGRDRALGGGLVAAMIAAQAVKNVDAACSAALASAPAAPRAWAHAALEGIERSWPAPDDWLEDELVTTSGVFLSVLSDDQLARLPASVRTAELEVNPLEALMLADALPHELARFDRVKRAALLEPKMRDVELIAIEADEAASWNPIRGVASPSYAKFFARDDACRESLKKLVAAAAK